MSWLCQLRKLVILAFQITSVSSWCHLKQPSNMPPNQGLDLDALRALASEPEHREIRCAILGCGMMGQEHISYVAGYPSVQVRFLCDPHEPSLEKSMRVFQKFSNHNADSLPTLLNDEKDLLGFANDIDLLVIASPNYLHTPSMLKWAKKDITILVEKPVAVSQEQHDLLRDLMESAECQARIWVAMEYRYIPAIAKLLQLLPKVGAIKMTTIRENRYPFLHKVGAWNRDASKTGDTLVEKCCHFFDLFRLITGKEVSQAGVRSLVQRGLNYGDEALDFESPIIDSAYVILPFKENCTLHESPKRQSRKSVTGCLELCMYAEGSRHREEIIVTGTEGRLEAYLPENKVYFFQRPDSHVWPDRSEPPPPESIRETVFDCSNVKDIHGIQDEMPTHGGYHYSSTAFEWYHLIEAIHAWRDTGKWKPHVSLDDGLKAVEMGLCATRSIVENECDPVY